MYELAGLILALGASILFIVGTILLGFGAWVWANAIAACARASYHLASAKAQAEVIDSTQEALDDVRDARSYREGYQEPTDAELREFARAAAADESTDITTARNEGVEEAPEVPPDQMYVHEDDDAL